MIDENQAAATLFGDSMPSATPAPVGESAATSEEPVLRTDAEIEAALYKGEPEPVNLAHVSDEVQAIRDTQERRMFNAQDMLKDAIKDTEFANAEVDPEVVQRGIVEVREIAADLGLSRAEIQTLKDRTAAYRSQPVPPEQQVDATIAALNREFGTDARQALMDARALVARDPRVGRIIEALGVGNDPQVVVMLAKQARSQIAAGHLRGKGRAR